MKELTTGRKLASWLLSATLVVAFAPAVAAPTQAQAADFTNAEIAAAEAYVESVAADGVDSITLYDARKVVSHAENELADMSRRAELSEDAANIILACQQAVKDIPAAQAQLNAVSINDFSATADMQRTTLKWTTSNPQKAKGIFYEVNYRTKGTKGWPAANKFTLAGKKNSKGYYFAKIENLKKNTEYQFRVRAAKRIFGETVYSAWPKTISRVVLPKYKTGKYKVKVSSLNVRKSASTKAKIVKTLKKNKAVKATKIQVKNAQVWGKVSFTMKERVTSGLKYQIRYREDSEDTWTYTTASTIAKANSKIKKLTDEDMTVRVRAYKKIDGSNVYGSWAKKTSSVKLYQNKSYSGYVQMANLKKA